MRVAQLVFLIAALTGCEVEGVYKPTLLSHGGPVTVKAPNEYGGYAGVTFIVAAKDQKVRISCTNARLAVSSSVVLSPTVDNLRCADPEHELSPGEFISLRFQFPISMLKDGKLFSRSGQPTRIELHLPTSVNDKWSTLTYSFELNKSYHLAIPFSKG